MKMRLSKYLPFLLTIFLFFTITIVAAQCPMCRATAEKSDYAKGLNTGILYLLLAPVVILGGVLFIWFRNKDSFATKEQ